MYKNVTYSDASSKATPRDSDASNRSDSSWSKRRRSRGRHSSLPSFFRRQSIKGGMYPSPTFDPDGRRNTTSLRKIVTEEPKPKERCSAVLKFAQSFSTIVVSPLFLRHRNIFFFCMEFFAPALIALIIFAAFTSGISWRQVHYNKVEASGRNIKFPDITMNEATSAFRSLHTDSRKQALIFYSPVTEFTVAVMDKTLEILGINENNFVFKRGQSSFGAVGVNDTLEMYERAMFHRNERISHGEPVGVVFHYDPKEISSMTKVPYNVTYSISVFDESIAATKEQFPYVPPAESENWKTPYLKSGFIGLQYAIEESIIRLILEKQKDTELQEREKNVQLKARSLEINGEDEDALLNSDEIDEDLLNFLISETLEKIKKEKEKRERTQAFGQDPNVDSGGAYGRSLRGGGKGIGLSQRVRPITTLEDLPQKRLRTFSSDHNNGTEKFRDLLSYVVTFTLVVAYTLMTFFTVKHIAEENVSGIKELLQIHGLPHYVHWTMLFFHAIVFRLISSALIFLAFRIDYGNGRIAESVSTEVLFMIIYIHQLALTFLNYFIACYITSIRMCGMIAVSLSALSFYVPETFSDMKLIGSFTDSTVTILFPNWAFRHAMRCLLDHEAAEKRIDWSNVMEVEVHESHSNTVSVGEAMLTMGIMGIVYFFLAMYVDITGGSRLFPYTTAAKLHSLRDWIKKKRDTWAQQKEAQRMQRLSEMGGEDNSFSRPPIYEDAHPDKECFVRVRNLSKYYSKHKVALDNLSINVMHEEITVFLGHSGCGKSTLISILAGMVKPSNGYATINGFDVSIHTNKARQFIGVCPQKLVAFNLLTVREHIHLCYRLRGYPNKECRQHAATVLTQLKLWNVRTSLPGNLTKDELRRLGLAMAFADAPKIILLDEPTRGMDAIGRREVWDIILSLRHYHTIILTTNYMDEAEHLADRLALIAHGRLVCFGGLDYLKSQYDTGYFLKLVPFTSQFIDANAVVNFVRGILGENVHIKRHKRLKDVDTLELELPSKEKDNFADFCDELEQKKVDLHIMKYSIRQVHLNDIFIKICSSVAADGHALDLYVRRDSAGDIKTVLTSAIPEIPEGTTKTVTRVDLLMCLVRRGWTVLYKGSYAMLMHFVIPLVVIWTVVFQAKLFVQARGENPEMALSTENFGSNQRIFARVAEDDPSVNYSSHISRVLYPYGEHLSKEEPVIPKLFEAFHSDPTNMGNTQDKHMVAFEFGKYANDYEIVGYFASGVLHSAPVALNLMNNIILSVVSEPERNVTQNWRPYSVTPRNDPMPQVPESQFEHGCGVPCILLAVVMSFALAFIVHNACLLPMMEKENGMKHIILMCGVEPFIYWLSICIVDLIVMLFISVIIVLIFLSDLYQTFYSKEVLTAVWFICALYLMWSGLMYVYYVSSVLSNKFNGYNFLAVFHLIFGIVLTVWMIFSPPDSGFGIFCRNVFLFFLPPYTITSALYHFFSNSGQRNICRNINSFITTICDDSKNAHHHYTYTGHKTNQRSLYVDLDQIDPKFTRCCARICKIGGTCFKPPTVFNSSDETWESPGVVTDVCALIFQGFLYWGLLMIAERQLFSRLAQYISLKFLKAQDKRVSPEKKESKTTKEVQNEGRAVFASLKSEHWPEDLAMVCQNLTKSFSSTMIIKDFNLHVKKGQCIAILGRGDSGKSSIVKMMAGEMLPTKGNCYMENIDLRKHRKEYLSHIGYCPQKSCLFPEFTGTQMMMLIGKLRGIPPSILSTHINKWMNVMGLAEVANDPCKVYGDGMRQRLRTAMSLIGEPDIIILDEPTTGVDPAARERLWCVLEHLNQKGFTIVFTTYSTDEAFSLAEKVVVLSEGTAQIIGDPETIQKTYARGHIITFTLNHDIMSSIEMVSIADKRVVEFKDHVLQLFKHIDLLDEHDEMLMYFLRDVRLTWAEVFRRGHYLATVHDYIIASYEVTEGGVDDIFVFLANKYHELNQPRGSVSSEPNVPTKEIDEMKELRKSQERYKYSKYNI